MMAAPYWRYRRSEFDVVVPLIVSLIKKPEALKALSDHSHTGEDAIAEDDVPHAQHQKASSVASDAS